MNALPVYLPAVFLLVVLATAYAFLRAAAFRKPVILWTLAWLLLQSGISISGFYTHYSGLPPRIALLIAPPLLLTVLALCTVRGRAFLDSLDARTLTLLHLVRVPVELTLWGLALYRVAPVLITFEGANYDILSGLSAPVVFYLVFVKRRAGRKLLLLWNLACLALLVNVVTHALLSVPTPLQRFSFHQPLVAVGYFPFTLLPGFVVPVVLLAQVTMLRRSLRAKAPAAAMPAVA